MADEATRNYERRSTYEQWVEAQGIPIINDLSVPNLKELTLGPWERLGADGAIVDLQGAEGMSNAYLLEMKGGGSVKAERHVYDELVYVLSGCGATTVWNEGGAKRTFEWHEGSLFAIPINAWHQFFNGLGAEAARFYIVSSGPLIMNFYHNLDFVFNNNFIFSDRFDGREDFFNNGGRVLAGRFWETNFIEDVRTFPLLDWKERGAGGMHRGFEIGDSTLAAHVSQFPVGTYKKAHRHGPGANVIIVEGQGYSLLWQQGRENERVKVDWKPGSVLAPPNMWFHQHFNTGGAPAKYLALRWGSRKYPLFPNVGKRAKNDLSIKEGGSQIEYVEEEPFIRRLFEEELAKNGVECRMAPVKYKG